MDPTQPEPFRIADAIEVRDECPYCTGRQLVPRLLRADHLARFHPEQHAPAAGAQQPEPEERRESPFSETLAAAGVTRVQFDASFHRERLMQAFSDAGAICGDCGAQPGDRDCPDCERARGWYADAALAIRDRQVEQLAAGRATWKAKAEEIEADRDRLRAELGQARGTTGQDTTVPAHGEQGDAAWQREWDARPIGADVSDLVEVTGGQEIRQQIVAALMRWAERGNNPAYAAARRPETVTRNAYDRADAVLPVVRAAVAAGARRALEDAAGRVDAQAVRETAASSSDYSQEMYAAARLRYQAVELRRTAADRPDPSVDPVTGLYVGYRDRAVIAEAALADVLRLVSEVTVEANDIGGVDINDLVTRLADAGHPLPDDEGDDAA